MSLDLYHHEVVPQEMQCPTCEIINVQDFPDEFKAKFADYLFDVGVMVVDWEKTIESIIGVHYGSFTDRYERFLEAGGKFYFAPKDCENPMDSESLVVIEEHELYQAKRIDPHITVRRLGYQRKGMKDSFFTKFANNQVIIDSESVHKMMSFCDSVDSMENFSEGFIDSWTDTSFVMVQY